MRTFQRPDIGISGPGPLHGDVSRLMNLLIDSDVTWRPQIVDFAIVTDDSFRGHAFADRELWRAGQ